MEYAVEICPDSVVYMISFMKIDSVFLKVDGVYKGIQTAW
jgi:hypothetical protein